MRPYDTLRVLDVISNIKTPMKIVIQRCLAARVEVEGQIVGEIARGLAVFVGVESGDGEAHVAKMARKIIGLRIFDNDEGRFDLSLLDVGGQVLAISNFTLCGDARKGTRPSFSGAAKPDSANAIFAGFVTLLREQNVVVASGVFGANMKVTVENDGPVTMILQT